MKSQALQFLESLVGPTTVGMLVRAYRTLHDITQEELADKLGLKKSYISDIENDRKLPSLAKVKEIAEQLEDSVNLYARIWTEQTYRESGLEFDDVSNIRPLKKTALAAPKRPQIVRPAPSESRTIHAKKAAAKKVSPIRKHLHAKTHGTRKKAAKKI